MFLPNQSTHERLSHHLIRQANTQKCYLFKTWHCYEILLFVQLLIAQGNYLENRHGFDILLEPLKLFAF